jgi:hypothetical protein
MNVVLVSLSGRAAAQERVGSACDNTRRGAARARRPARRRACYTRASPSGLLHLPGRAPLCPSPPLSAVPQRPASCRPTQTRARGSARRRAPLTHGPSLRTTEKMSSQDIEYSEKYYDDDFEYRCALHPRGPHPPPLLSCSTSHLCAPRIGDARARRAARATCVRRHVILPKHVSKNAPKGRLLSESEWRGLGVQQSRGWVHYAIHRCARERRACTAARACRRARDRQQAARPWRARPAAAVGSLTAPADSLKTRRSQAGAAHLALPAPAGHGPDDGSRARQAHRPGHRQGRRIGPQWRLVEARRDL